MVSLKKVLLLPAAVAASWVVLGSGSQAHAKGGGDVPKVDFTKQVRPLLAENCY